MSCEASFDERHLSKNVSDWLKEYVGYLEQRGHTQQTTHAYRHAIGHFFSWWQVQEQQGTPNRPDLVRAFLVEHVPVCACPGRIVRSARTLRAALNQFLLMNGQPRVVRVSAKFAAPFVDTVRDFDYYLHQICGLAEQTRRTRCRLVAEVLRRIFGNRPVQVERLTPAVLIDTVTAWAYEARPSVATTMVGALRSYLRFLHFQGTFDQDVAAALAAPARWSLTSVPPALSASDLDRFWAVFERSKPIGQRDYAMARCLADLGLRCHEVAALSLEAVDWRGGVVTLSHAKSKRCDRLPLPCTTGEALVAYLQQGRPQCNSRALFVHHRAPVGTAVAKTTVRGAVRRAFQRAGLPWSGTHVLRHTAARRMLSGGCSLKEIADVLRHRSIDTTAIYARVDLPHLAQVALPWPEMQP